MDIFSIIERLGLTKFVETGLELLKNAPTLMLSIFGFGLLIFFHELGHYAFAKLFGVGTPTFSIGFGPTLAKIRFFDTNFNLSIIPLGGFVQMKDSDINDDDEVDPSKVPGLFFEDISYWKKFLILIGGVLFNTLLGFALLTGCNYFSEQEAYLEGLEIIGIEKKSSAEKSGFRIGEIIIGVDGIGFEDDSDGGTRSPLRQRLEARLGTTTNINLIRKNGTKESVGVKLQTQAELDEKKQTSILGVALKPKIGYRPLDKKPTLFESIQTAFCQSTSALKTTALGFMTILQQKKLNGISGPVEIISTGMNAVTAGIITFLRVLAIVSFSLAFFNVIPFGPLDGSQLFVVTIESIFRRRFSILQHYKALSTLLLLGLLLAITINDLFRTPRALFLVGAMVIFFIYDKLIK